MKRGFGPAVPLMLAAVIAALAVITGAASARAESAVSVLCYHSFPDKKKMDPFSFTIEELNSQIMQLKKEGFRFVSINDVISGRIAGTKNVLITIDDGNKSVYEAHKKVFKPNGIRPLLGIYPNIIINKKHYALTWEKLAELANDGCDIAAHGYFHLKINKKLHDKNPSYFKKEIYLVKKVLEEKLNRKITVFVYPFGLRDDLTIKTLRDAGYRYAFTINNGRIDIPLATGGDRSFELPRYMVTRTSWKYCFNSVVRNARHRTAYRVAAADGPSMERGGMSAVNRAPAERHDPAAQLYARLAESMEKTAMADGKAEKNNKQMKDSRAKKKIEKKTGIDSESGPVPEEKRILAGEKPRPARGKERDRVRARPEAAKVPDIFEPVKKKKIPGETGRTTATRERLVFPEKERGSVTATPIQRVASGVKRDILDLERPAVLTDRKRHASVFSLDVEPSGRRDPGIKDAPLREGIAISLEARVAKGTNPYLSGMKDQYHGINSKSLHTYRGFIGLVSGKIDRIKHTIRKYVLSHF